MIQYVDAVKGLDSNDGSQARPWKTLTKLSAMVQPGGRYVLKGTFPDQRFRPNVDGTAAAPITVVGDLHNRARIIRGLSGSGIDLSTGRSWYVFEDITLEGCGPLAYACLNGATHNIARRLRLINDSHAAFRAHSPDNTLEDSYIGQAGKRSLNSGNGIDIDNGSSRTTLLRVTVEDAGHGCLQIGGDQPADDPVTDTVVLDCVFRNSWATPLIMTGQGSHAIISGCLIENGARDADWASVFPRPGIECVSSYNTIRRNTVRNNAGGGIQLQAYTYGTYFNQDCIGNVIEDNDFLDNGDSGWPVNGYGYALLIKQLNGRQVKDNFIRRNRFLRNSGYVYNAITAQIFVDLAANRLADGTYSWWPDGDFNGNRFEENTFLRVEDPSSAGEVIVLMALPWARTNNTVNPNVWYTLPQFEATFPGMVGNVESLPPVPPPLPNRGDVLASSLEAALGVYRAP